MNRRTKITQYLQWAYPYTSVSQLPIEEFLKNSLPTLLIMLLIHPGFALCLIFFFSCHKIRLYLLPQPPHDEISKIVNL